MPVSRLLSAVLRKLGTSPVGRCLVLTGARQTGKTTLLRNEFPDFEYFNFDEILARENIARQPAAHWLAREKRCFVFDEVQKAPDFLGTVKVLLDTGPEDLRVILSGSAQIRLLGGVRESLAGRSTARELFPFSVAELSGGGIPLIEPLLSCQNESEVRRLLEPWLTNTVTSSPVARAAAAFASIQAWGAMPRLSELREDEWKRIWLEEYCRTYLERDVADLGRVSDLDDFTRLGRVAAGRTARIVNFADLARDADLSPVTAKKYLRYLELSYQTFLLPPFRKAGTNLTKASRLHWVDLGVARILSGRTAGLSGDLFENAVVAEFWKYIRTLHPRLWLGHLRTKDGREVDLLLRTTAGYFAFECKSANSAHTTDTRHLRGLESLLDAPLLGRFVLHNGKAGDILADGSWSLPASALFAGFN